MDKDQQMFTGIITAIGVVDEVISLNEGRKIRITSSYDCRTIAIGASIACDGVCLTVVNKSEAWFEVEAWEEAVRLTTIKDWQKNTRINLERSLKIGDELGGHLVSGHIDATAKIIELTPVGEAKRIYFKSSDTGLMPFIAKKGSIAVNGVSLTVNDVRDDIFEVLLIDHSLKVTTFGEKIVGDYVNLEIDQLARYSVRYSEAKRQL